MLTVLIRTVIIYFIAVFSLRFMGKRQVGEMQLSELTTAVLLSELLASPATNPDIPLIYGIIPLTALVTFEVLISFIVTKSRIAGNIFDNRPSIVIEHGVIKQDELKKLRFGINELVSELRQKDIPSISDVDYAILEPSGKLSVFKKGDTALSFNAVYDGRLCREAMAASGMSESDVFKILKKKKLGLSDTFLLTVGGDGEAIIIKKEKSK